MTKPSATIPKSEPSTPWKDEEWVHFDDAAEAYANFVEVSTGFAQRLLREQCASGNIRSIRYTYEPGDEGGPNADLLKPSEWVANPYLDFEAEYVPGDDYGDPNDPHYGEPYPWTYIDVSEDDVVYWIIQAKPKLSLPPSVRQGKLPRIKAMLAKLYPDGVPDPALCSRKELQGRLVKDDPTLKSLDPKTLKAAIDEYNADRRRKADRKRPEGKGNPNASD
jgi:hypothetical protein